MTDKFTCRGISKETGEFVYGYPFFDPNDNIWKIIHYEGAHEVEADFLCTEITQEPDKFFKTIDGVDYFYGDKVKITRAIPNTDNEDLSTTQEDIKEVMIDENTYILLWDCLGSKLELILD